MFWRSIDRPRGPVPRPPARSRVPALALGAPAAALFSAALSFVVAVRRAVHGALPEWLGSGGLIGAAGLACLASAVWFLARLGVLELDESGLSRPWSRRHGLWLVGGTWLAYAPWLGRSSLIDPWETHYGEVAREVLARNDWISFWWAQDGFFWSKPPLSIWLEAASFAVLGVHFEPDHLLDSVGRAPAEPEWAVRLPALLLSLGALYLSYRLVRRGFGRRAALYGGVVLATTPFWSLLARQATTDMPYVACATAAIALFGCGLCAPPELRLPSYEVAFGKRTLRLDASRLLLAAVAATALVQIGYLVSLHFSLGSQGLTLQSDRFLQGSGGGNCALSLPSNAPCATLGPELPALAPGLLACVWSGALAALVWLERGERRVQRWCFVGAWFAVALSFLAKGAPGLVLPLAVAGTSLLAAGRLRELSRLELPALALILLAVAMPWYAQAFARHGMPFFDRLFRHDMIDRAFSHVHDTNAGDDVSLGYYLWQLGYGLFPWTGLSLLGFVAALRGSRSAGARAEIQSLLALWFALSFALFSAALTKYHHYILPAVVPAALLAGVLLERAASPAPDGAPPRLQPAARSAALGLAGLTAAVVLLAVGRDLSVNAAVDGQARFMHLFTYNYARPWPPALQFRELLWVVAVSFACASAAWLLPRLRRHVVTAMLLGAIGFALFLVGCYLPLASPHYGQRELLLEYYARRANRAEPVLAYQMNWKGENFYTGNRVVVFVSSGQPLHDYLRELERSGRRTFFVMTEHRRRGSLESDLGRVRRFEQLTTPEQNNKFFLARVEL